MTTNYLDGVLTRVILLRQIAALMPRRDWTREELIVAFNLYCKIPFGRIHIRKT